MSLQPVVPTADELEPAWQALEAAFGGAAHPDDRAAELDVVDPSRQLVVRDAGQVVATAGSFRLEMALPGAVATVAGITWVGVAPTHRRRGLLRDLMTRMLTDSHELGEPVAALWASEAAIYQRFGFGPASWQLSLRVPSRARFARPYEPGELRLVEPDPALLAPLHDRVAPRRPGSWQRDAAWWAQRVHDPEHRREGGSPLRCVLADGGYALYSTVPAFGAAGPDGRVRLRELVAETPAVAARLWRYVLDLDLMRTVEARVPVDEPLLHLLAEPRAAGGRLGDNLWVRPVEVCGALEARRYARDVDVVLDVDDPVCAWNRRRVRLSADAAGAVCAPTTDPADLSLGVADLGAALLGGTSLHARALGGTVVEHRPGSLAATATALGPLGPAPWCPMTF